MLRSTLLINSRNSYQGMQAFLNVDADPPSGCDGTVAWTVLLTLLLRIHPSITRKKGDNGISWPYRLITPNTPIVVTAVLVTRPDGLLIATSMELQSRPPAPGFYGKRCLLRLSARVWRTRCL